MSAKRSDAWLEKLRSVDASAAREVEYLDEHLAVLGAEIARLREALKPFAEELEKMEYILGKQVDADSLRYRDSGLTISDLRRARAALPPKS